MNNSSNICPQCRERFSTRLPSTKHYSRCGLPLTLSCGHGVCYHCVVSKRHKNKNLNTTSHKTGPEYTSVCCKVCQHVSNIPHEAVKNVLAVVNCYQMGLTLMEDLEFEIAGENIGFQGRYGELFVPKSPETSINRPPFIHPGDCPRHKIPMDYWCYEDEVPLCSGCRISHHVAHDVVKITEKNKDEIDEFYTAVDETVKMIGDMKKTCKAIREKTGSVHSEYNTLIKQARSHFSHLHSILAMREQQVQQVLFEAFEECTQPLKHVEKNLHEAYYDISCQLGNAHTAVNSPETTKRSIVRCTESLRRFGFYQQAVQTTRHHLDPVSYSARMEPVADFSDYLLNNPALSLIVDEFENKASWTLLQTQYDELKQEKNRSIVAAMNAVSPRGPVENKRARKQLFNELDVTPIVISQAAKQCQAGNEITGLVVHLDADRFYVQIHGPSVSEFEVLQAKIHLHEAKPVPRLHELHPGQLIAGRFCGQWYRALIESINLKCDDLVIYFIDYGNRELTTVKNVRLLSEKLTSLPAQAVRCALTDRPDLTTVFTNSPSQVVRMNIDRVESGGVGRLDEPELTLWVTLIEEPAESKMINWLLPEKDTEPLVFPSSIHKVRSTPTPPPAGANLIQKKRLPANKKANVPVAAPPPVVKAVYEGQENRFRTKIFLVHLNSAGHFYVRVETAEKTFLNLTQQLDSNYSGQGMGIRLRPSEVTSGVNCAVWLEQWHRCKIIRLDKNDMVLVSLIDVGRTASVEATQLFRLDEPRWMDTPAMALRCRLWGIRPAGHVRNWSGSSTDKVKELMKLSSALYVQVYFIQEELVEDGIYQPIHYVRLYYEYLQVGGPLEFDQTLTGCVNDDLLKIGLALRQPMAVTVQPIPKRWLPSLSLPPELEAIPSWVDEDGRVFIQHLPGPMNHLELISQLLNWHYAKSSPSQDDLEHWDKDEPCVAQYSKDKNWCRAIVLSADDVTKTASLLFVDYGNQEKEVAYGVMRKSLICYEYAVQATRCRLAKYPGNVAPTGSELDILDSVLVNKHCQVRVKMISGEPVIEIHLLSSGSDNLDEVFELLRPTKQVISPIPPTIQTPAPTILLSSADMDDSIFDATSSEFSNDDYSIFHFDERDIETEMYRPLSIPDRRFLPIRILSLLDETRAVIQPARYSLNDSPSEWQDQVDGFARLESELQRTAPLFPDVGVIDHGSPCGCHHPADDRWYRGIIIGYADDSLRNVRVELVDIGLVADLARCRIKQLPTEYLDLPRHSVVCRLIDYPIHPMCPPDMTLIRQCMEMETPLKAYFKETGQPLEMTLFYKDSAAKLIPALELE